MAEKTFQRVGDGGMRFTRIERGNGFLLLMCGHAAEHAPDLAQLDRIFAKTIEADEDFSMVAVDGAGDSFLYFGTHAAAREFMDALMPALADAATTDYRTEIVAVLDALGSDAVRVCENGGPEDVCASLAVSVRKLQKRSAAATTSPDAEQIAEGIVDDLFGNSARLILSDHGEDKGRSGWSRVVVKERIVDTITAALSAPLLH